MRRGFTLLEILTVVAVIAIMVTASVVSVRQGQASSRIRGATRDIFAVIRHARSMALVSQQPSIITYAETTDGDEPAAKIDIVTAKMFNDNAVRYAKTLGGEDVDLLANDKSEDSSDDASSSSKKSSEDAAEMKGGETVEDILFAPISSDVVRGIRLKVLREGETLEGAVVEARDKPKISVFSNVDFLLGKFNEKKASTKTETAAKSAEPSAASATSVDSQEAVSIVWEANGRTEPHRVWIYADGKEPESGLMISIDRFGGAKVLSGDGREDDER